MQALTFRACRYSAFAVIRGRYGVLVRPYSSPSSAIAGGPVVPVLLSDIGEGIAEVEILRWFTSKGSTVRQFDPLVEVQSDKATVEITSRYNGVVHELSYEPGEIAHVGKPLCYIRTEHAVLSDASQTTAQISRQGGIGNIAVLDAETEAFESKQMKSQTFSTELEQRSDDNHQKQMSREHNETTKEQVETRPLAIPAVRRLAGEHGLRLEQIQGTGRDGRVTKEDVYRYLQKMDEPAVAPCQTSDMKTKGPETWTSRINQPPVASKVERVKIRGLMRAMVKSMTASAAIPHLGLGEEVNADALYELRQQLKPSVEKHGIRLTYLPFFIKATSLALSDFPLLNASVDESCENVIYHPSHNISIAMDTSDGLVTPNVKHVEQLSITGIAQELARLGQEADRGRFSQEDLTGGTFALSNIGSIGGTYTSPRVVSGQVAIGALGRMRRVPVVRDDEDCVSVARVIHVSWSADHRIVDGATIANFSNAWKSYVENPALMLLHLK